MKIAIYTDYFKDGVLPYGGGAEIYALYLAMILSKSNEVVIFSNKVKDQNVGFEDLFIYYGIKPVGKINFEYADSIGWKPGRFSREEKLYKDFLSTINNKFDLFINVSDNTLWGFTDTNSKTKSIKIIHYPKAFFDEKSDFLSRFFKKEKFVNSYDLFLANSKFTKKCAEEINCVDAKVLYPPIFKEPISLDKIYVKENIIICPGRIVPDKKVFELANCFRKFYINNRKWKFIIIGNVNPADINYFNKIENVLKGTNHEMIFDADSKTFDSYLEKSKIIWSAKGLNENDGLWIEQFGMTLAEAMVKGCVPVVINKGGHKEIVNKDCGFLWDDLNGLEHKTQFVADNNKLFEKFSKAAIKTSERFLIRNFEKCLFDYIDKVI